MRGKVICPRFCKCAKFQAQYSAESHLPSSKGDYGTGNKKCFDAKFNLIKHFGQSRQVLGVAIRASH